MVVFNTTEYEFSHGRKPRGDGGWVFSFKRNPDVMTEIFFVHGIYTVAKKAAAKKAKSENQREVFVCP